MTPDSPCGNCGHALKWHNPCSKCRQTVSLDPKAHPDSRCQGFVPKGSKR
jgi:hypothetical protein